MIDHGSQSLLRRVIEHTVVSWGIFPQRCKVTKCAGRVRPRLLFQTGYLSLCCSQRTFARFDFESISPGLFRPFPITSSCQRYGTSNSYSAQRPPDRAGQSQQRRAGCHSATAGRQRTTAQPRERCARGRRAGETGNRRARACCAKRSGDRHGRRGAQGSYGGAGTRNSRTSCCAYLGDASSLVFMLQHIFSKSIRLQFEVRNGLLEFCRRIRQ